MEKNSTDIFTRCFKTKMRAFILLYCFIYIATIYFTCFKFHRLSIMSFFPIKLLPLMFAKVFGDMLCCAVNKVSIYQEESRKKIRRMFAILIISATVAGSLLRIAGIDLTWLII